MGDTNESASVNALTRDSRIDLDSSKESVDIVVVNDDEGEGVEENDSECEIISVSSDIEQEMRWRNVTRLNTLISAGYTNPRLLLTRIFGLDSGILPSDNNSLWNIIFSIMSDPPRRKRLKQFSTIESVIKLLQESSNILVLTGAGISVSCGIPDFRSKNGVYARLSRDFPDLRNPQNMFDMKYFINNPKPFFSFAKELFPGQFKPSYTHRFIRLLERKCKLLRNYTQNIDTLEQIAGVTKIIQCHGSFATATCVSCRHQVLGDEIREAIMNKRIPYCPHCRPDLGLKGVPTATDGNTVSTASSSSIIHGVMKPDIVFFGEGLPIEFHSSLQEDMKEVDLVLIMGSSLKVKPVSHIPESVPANVPQILINRESLSHRRFDTELLGECDVILEHICRLLGWDVDEVSDTESLVPVDTTSLNEVDLNIPLNAAVAALVSDSTIATHPGGAGDEASIVVKSPRVSPQSEKATTGTAELGTENITELNTETNTTNSLSKDIRPLSTEPIASPEVSKVLMDDIGSASVTVVGNDKQILEGTSERPIDVDGFDSDSNSDSLSRTSEDSKTTFNLSDYLPENSYTYFQPNTYIFKGAEVILTLDSACEYLQNQLHRDQKSPKATESANSSPESSSSSEGDALMQRLLRRCEEDSELQRNRADVTNSVEVEGEDDVEVIDCDSLLDEQTPQKCNDHKKSQPADGGIDIDACEGESKNLPLTTNGNPPESKRRRCNESGGGNRGKNKEANDNSPECTSTSEDETVIS